MKPYNYTFSLQPQFVFGFLGGSTPGEIQVTGGQAPIQPVVGGVSPNIKVYPAVSPFSGYYDVSIAVPFELQDIASAGQFVTMYDAYKINKISLNCEFLSNSANIAAPDSVGNGIMPSAHFYWDQDDAALATAVTQLSGKQGVKIRQFGNKGKMSFSTSARPKVVQALLSDGQTLVAGGIGKSQWINCTQPKVKHYALKLWISDVFLGNAPNENTAFRFNWRYNVSFRAPLVTT